MHKKYRPNTAVRQIHYVYPYAHSQNYYEVGVAMQIEDLLDECLRIQAHRGDVAALLAQYPEIRKEVEGLLALANSTARLPQASLPAANRERMLARLRYQMQNPPRDDPKVHMRFDSEEFLHILAYRVGATREEIWRYIGPAGARQFSEFLGLPGYNGMFDALGLMVRCLRVLENQGVPL
jgi:hypothetical protein